MKPLRLLFAAILVLAASPSFALASKTQESTFQDDPLLVYGSPEQQIATLDTLQGFGVDRIRVSVFWALLAPANDQVQKPNVDTADPAAYQEKVWAKYDHLIQAAQARGILVNLNFTSPVPRWASTDSPRADIQQTFNPNPEEFGKFVRAVGTRYSGSYNGLPRVDFWSIWNEPNQAGWLTPQWSPDPRPGSKSQIDAAPSIYRNLVAAAWQALADSGHGSDTILIGETAPQGQGNKKELTQSIDALKFIRRLYCVDNNINVLKGAQASLRNCPGDIATFVAQNPALFRATGYAHHPYALLTPPSRRSRNSDWVSMADLRALSSELSRIYRRYRQKTQSRRGVPLYLTEYGYQTKPDPFAGKVVSFNRQAAWINQAEYMAFKNPNVRAVNQFLLTDDAPVAGVDARKSPNLAWRTFQSGLKLLSGKRKVSYKAYMTPFFVKQQRVRRGRSTGVFGMLRPAAPTTRERASIQFRARGAKRWRTRRTVTVRGPRHYFETRVTVPSTGYLRIRWTHGSRTLTSRTANVTAVRR
ncbi:MAG: cellulase family glycosylhydrolase [Solirubrobacteraceae bacterium]|nr:cellulase family glycosylhydrolase [Solirubrobacteraceae bacterium]